MQFELVYLDKLLYNFAVFALGIKYFFSSIQRSRLKSVLRLTIISLSINIGAFVVAISLMRGFQTEVMTKLLHVHGHAQMYPVMDLPKQDVKRDSTVVEKLPLRIRPIATRILDSMETPAPSLKQVVVKAQAQCILNKEPMSRPIMITAMSEDDAQYTIRDYLKSGEVSFNKAGDIWPIAIGSKLAESINASVGSEFQLLISNLGELQTAQCKIVAIFDFGFYEFDKGTIFTPLELVDQYFPGTRKFGVIYIDQPDKIEEYIQSIGKINEDTEIDSWKDMYRSIETMFKTHAIGITLLMGMFIISGIIQSVSSLSILMSDRAYDMSVLTMLGMSKRQKYAIFATYGTLISLSNVFFGMITGIVLSIVYPYLRDTLEDFTAIKIIDPDSFWISTFNPKLMLSDLLMIAAGSLGVMVLGMLIGSYFVIKTENIEGIKD